MQTRETLTLADILGGPGDFRPVAYYDKHMDCIRVELRDCSITEVRIDKTLTVLRDNYYPPERQPPLVGFMIEGVTHLFREWGIPLAGVLLVTTIVDRLLKELPVDLENVNPTIKEDIARIGTVSADIELSVDMDTKELPLAAANLCPDPDAKSRARS